jgi:LDH2 family malate/lactate/ureidoglycolate dehydrogenase
VSHFFGAIRIDTFRDPAGFRRDMDHLLLSLRTSTPAVGAARVYFAGLRELEHEQEAAQRGVPLLRQTYDHIVQVGRANGAKPPPTA